MLVPVPVGSYPLGPSNGHVHLRTAREGLAARVGHDLLLTVSRWSGCLAVGPGRLTLSLELELRSLQVLKALGGITALTRGDRETIQRTAQRLMQAGAHPVATFSAEGPVLLEAGGWLDGRLRLHGRARPVSLLVERTAPLTWRATTTVLQSGFGIQPYSALLGALRLADPVTVEALVTLPAAAVPSVEEAG